jgi:hypothetical protein
MITLYASTGTTNMGDFLNCLPVLSGISKIYGKIDLIIKDEMKKFNGFRDLLSYQEMFNTVKFESEISPLLPLECIPFNSWINDFSFDGVNPIETTRYEKYFKLNINLTFEVDSEFTLQIPYLNVGNHGIVVGDRCAKTTSDKRRESNVIQNSNNFTDAEYLNYGNSCIFNANIIKQCDKFVTTFTGISILADLMRVPLDLYYTQDLDGWCDQSIEFSYKKHFYLNRNSTLKLLE